MARDIRADKVQAQAFSRTADLLATPRRESALLGLLVWSPFTNGSVIAEGLGISAQRVHALCRKNEPVTPEMRRDVVQLADCIADEARKALADRDANLSLCPAQAARAKVVMAWADAISDLAAWESMEILSTEGSI